MRTKALILSAMIGVAGIASSSAQNVYSVNVVGYINLTLSNTFSLIANQLDNGAGNLVTNIFSGVPIGTVIYKFNGTAYDSLTWLGTQWTPAGNRQMSLSPGEGVFVKKPASPATVNLTFVGEVMQGDLVNPVVLGFEIYSAMVPQQGGIKTVHNFQPVNGDTVYKYTGTAYQQKTWLQSGAVGFWQPAGEPVLNVGEAVFINSRSVQNWTRTFNVN